MTIARATRPTPLTIPDSLEIQALLEELLKIPHHNLLQQASYIFDVIALGLIDPTLELTAPVIETNLDHCRELMKVNDFYREQAFRLQAYFELQRTSLDIRPEYRTLGINKAAERLIPIQNPSVTNALIGDAFELIESERHQEHPRRFALIQMLGRGLGGKEPALLEDYSPYCLILGKILESYGAQNSEVAQRIANQAAADEEIRDLSIKLRMRESDNHRTYTQKAPVSARYLARRTSPVTESAKVLKRQLGSDQWLKRAAQGRKVPEVLIKHLETILATDPMALR